MTLILSAVVKRQFKSLNVIHVTTTVFIRYFQMKNELSSDFFLYFISFGQPVCVFRFNEKTSRAITQA